MTWFWLWFLLVVGALVVLGLLAWRLFRQGMAVLRDLGRVTTTMGETHAAREAVFDEWLVQRAEEDLAEAEQRERDRSSAPCRRRSVTGSRPRRPLRVVR